MTLKIMEAYTRDVGRGVARIDYDIMDKLKISTGDCVEIKGKRKTVAKALPLYPTDEGKGLIRVDGLMRKNLRVEIGSKIQIKKILAKPAIKITAQATEDIPPIDERYLADALEGVFIIVNDITMVPYFGGRLNFKITKTDPDGSVLISTKTQFTIHEKDEPIPKHDTELREFHIKYLKNSIDEDFGLMNLSKRAKIDYLETIIQLIRDK